MEDHHFASSSMPAVRRSFFVRDSIPGLLPWHVRLGLPPFPLATAWLGPARQPLLERALALGRRLARQQVGDADVLVERRPMDAPSTAEQPTDTPLLGRTMRQPGIPGQRHGD